MKSVNTVFDRHFENKKPLKSKWQIRQLDDILYFYHYHHLLLQYSLKYNTVMYSWWEKPTDKRGLDAALKYLQSKK